MVLVCGTVLSLIRSHTAKSNIKINQNVIYVICLQRAIKMSITATIKQDMSTPSKATYPTRKRAWDVCSIVYNKFEAFMQRVFCLERYSLVEKRDESRLTFPTGRSAVASPNVKSKFLFHFLDKIFFHLQQMNLHSFEIQ